MSKKNCAYRVVVLATILMLSFAPISFAADGDGSGSFSILDTIVEALDDFFGGDTESAEGDEDEDEGGVPDLSPKIDPIG